MHIPMCEGRERSHMEVSLYGEKNQIPVKKFLRSFSIPGTSCLTTVWPELCATTEQIARSVPLFIATDKLLRVFRTIDQF